MDCKGAKLTDACSAMRVITAREYLRVHVMNAGAYAAFPAGGGGVHFKLERTLGYQSLKDDI